MSVVERVDVDPTAARGMTVQALKRSELDALLPEWRELHHRTTSWSPFADPELQLIWCDLFVRRGRELVLTVRRAGTGDLVAVLPFFAPFSSRLVRYLRPFGGHHEALINEMPEISADPAHLRPALAAVIAWFGEHPTWDFVELSLHDDQPWLEPRWLVDAGLDGAIALHKKAYPSIVLELPAGGELPRLKRNLKESLRRSRNRMKAAEGKWSSLRAVPGDDDWAEALDDLVRLHGDRSRMGEEAPSHADLFAGTAQQAYLEALARAGATSFPVVHRLQLDGVAVAALLTFEYPGHTWIGLSGCDPEHWRLGAVTALQWEAVQHAAAAGHRQVFFSVGIDTPKLRWSENIRVRNGFVFAHPRRRSRLMFRVYWLYFHYRGSRVDLSPFGSLGHRRRLRQATAVAGKVLSGDQKSS